MKKIYINILVCFSVIAFFTSCEEELDLQNPTALSVENLLKTDNGFQQTKKMVLVR